MLNMKNIVPIYSAKMCNSIILVLSFFILMKNDCAFSSKNVYYKHNVSDRLIRTECISVFGQTNKVYENSVSMDKPMAYIFNVDRKYIQNSHVSERHSQQTTNLRIEVETNNASLQYPIMFAMRQQKHISTLEVPYESEGGHGTSKTSINRKKPKGIYHHAARTLCIDSKDGTDRSGRNVTVRVTTQSRSLVSFRIKLSLTEDFQLPIGKEKTLDVSPTSSQFFGVSFARPDMTQVKIRVTSNSSDCMTISVQRPQCPVYDLEHNIRYQGLWQTMSTRAAMTVQKLGWFAEGFVLVFVTHDDKEVCGRKDSFSSESTGTTTATNNRSRGFGDAYQSYDPPSKRITLLITDESRVANWIICLCLMIPIIATLLTALAVLCLFRNRHEWVVQILSEKFDNSTASPSLMGNQNGDSFQSHMDDGTNNVENTTVAEMLLNEIMADSTSSINSIRIKRASAIPVPAKRIRERESSSGCRWKSGLVVADFHCKQYHEVKKFSKRFYWTIGIVSIFYSIPVYQLVLHYLRVLYRTGEYDICFYNYLCAQRLGVLIDFNHFWSNASYVIFGVLYIFIVRRRSRNLCLPQHKHRKRLQDDETKQRGSGCCCCSSNSSTNPLGKVVQCCFCTFSRICFRWDHGVPAHFGVFYALGVALTMEGFLSAAYHLCPNQSTFQFDTCFMYVIAVLLLLKIYQFRHPVHFGANHTFAILAGFVIISVVGLLFEQGTEKDILIFKCIFIPIQYVLMIVLGIYYYAVGYVRDEETDEIVTDWRIYKNLGQLKSQRINGDRLILPFISFSICIAVLVYTELANIGFASYLLYLLVGNVLGTTLYYVGIMKPLHGEFKNRTWVQPVLYFLASGVIGGFSLQYFVRAPAQWELSASASRAENEDCLTGWFPFHPFYDSHDAWHFLSAAALFLAFMGLLIVDDDLITTPQQKIPVF